MRLTRIDGTIAILLLASACEPAEPADPYDGRAPVGATRAVDTPDRHFPLPAGATLSVDENRRLVKPPIEEGRVGAANSYVAGPLEVKIWSCNNWPQASHPVVQCTVDADYVLVGGGAWAAYGGAGAMLTASYPVDSSMRTWEGRSKDHGQPDPHVLTVYAMGLKIAGVSRSTLHGSIFINQRTSAVAAHPSANAPYFNGDIITLSFGCMDDWHGMGNMLTRCEHVLGAAGKDHIWSDPSAISHYRIGVAATIPGFGALEGLVTSATTSGPGFQEARLQHPAGYVPVGVSAEDSSASNPWSKGRLLTRMTPFTETLKVAAAASKDHFELAEGTVMVRLNSLRKAP